MDTFELHRQTWLPYFESDLALAVEETRQFAGMDIDNTWTRSHGDPSAKEIVERLELNGELRTGGRPVVHHSARTFEIAVDSAMHQASQLRGITRPVPHLGFDAAGRRIHRPVENIPKFIGNLNAEGFCGFGTGPGPYLRHEKSHYVVDTEFVSLLGDDWRGDILAFLRLVDQRDPQGPKKGLADALAAIEDPQNYLDGKTDVWPLEYRVQLEWSVERHGKRAGEEKERAKKRILNWQHLFRRELTFAHPGKRIGIVDESTPQNDRYIFYLVPHVGTKEQKTNHLIKRVTQVCNLVPSQINFFGAGDSMTDARIGLQSGMGAVVDFVLAGGSPLSQHLSPDGSHAGQPFAGEKLAHFTRVLANSRTEDPGVHMFKTPGVDRVPRRFIIADIAFPGEIGPASIVAALEYLRKHPR